MEDETLSLRYVRMLMDAVECRDVSRARFLTAANWDPKQLDAIEGRVPCSEFYRLCELALDLTGDPALGLRTMESIRPDSVDLVGQLVAHASTARTALDAHLRHYKLGGDKPRFQLIESDLHVSLQYDCPAGASARARRFLAELHMSGAQRLFRYFARQARPIRVNFEHEAPAYSAEYQNVFNGAEHFGQPATAIVFERSVMEAGRRYRDDEYHRTLCELADSRVSRLSKGVNYVDGVRKVIAEHDARAKVDMTTVARALGVSSRSLRRHLASEGTSFDAVVNDARARRARHLLSVQKLTIQETAYALGYSDTTAFHRAFKRWTGTTPSTLATDRRG